MSRHETSSSGRKRSFFKSLFKPLFSKNDHKDEKPSESVSVSSSEKDSMAIQNNEISHEDNQDEERTDKSDPVELVEGYTYLSTLGKGATSVVQLCIRTKDLSNNSQFESIHTMTGNMVAVKVLNRSLLKKMRDIKKVGRSMVVSTGLDKVQKEIAVMKKLRHPHVLRLHEVLDDMADDHMYLVLEYMKHGQIMYWDPKQKVYVRNSYFGGDNNLEDQNREVFRQMISAVDYLHNNSISHRDIKPENILLSEEGKCKLADFGVAQFFKDEGDNQNEGLVNNSAGTYAFMPPESISGVAFSAYNQDLWALGVSLYAMTFHKLPFYASNIDALLDLIEEEEVSFPEEDSLCFSDSLRDLLQKMLSKDPAQRMLLSQLKEHPWVASENIETSEVDSNLESPLEVSPEEIENAITPLMRTPLQTITTIKRASKLWKKKAQESSERLKSSQKVDEVSAASLATEPESLNQSLDSCNENKVRVVDDIDSNQTSND